MFFNVRLEGNALLAAVTTLTCFGFLLIGYDNGLMGGFVNSPAFTGTFGIDTKTGAGTNTIALVVSVYEIGCFIGAIVTSFVGDSLGRRKPVLIGVSVLIIGSPGVPFQKPKPTLTNNRRPAASDFIPRCPNACCACGKRNRYGLCQFDCACHTG
jgi:hypothetical protein